MLVTPFIFGEESNVFWKAPYFTLCLELTIFSLVISLAIYMKRLKTRTITPEEKAAILKKFNPDALVPDFDPNHPALIDKIVTGKVGKRTTVNGIDCLNLGSHNYLGLLGDETIQDTAISSLRKYGVGSCGPRGFYGTIDVHLELEERLAKYMNCEEAIVYSYAFSTVASAIPSYCKKNDVLFVDEEVSFAVQKGIEGARSTVYYFKHNDLVDLESLLKKQEEREKKNPKRQVKKFLICEGIYLNTGEICPLPGLVKLRKQYQLRLFMDESISFGTLGAHGRGCTEHFNIEKEEVDLISSSLEHAVGSIGGFCVGTSFIIEHQRLSGLGYCFSASLPPLLAQAAITALDKFEENPKFFTELQETSQKLHEKLSQITRLQLGGHALSPVKHFYLLNKQDYETEHAILNQIVNLCLENNLALTLASYIQHKEKKCPRPSIRITSCRLLTDTDINTACQALNRALDKVLG